MKIKRIATVLYDKDDPTSLPYYPTNTKAYWDIGVSASHVNVTANRKLSFLFEFDERTLSTGQKIIYAIYSRPKNGKAEFDKAPNLMGTVWTNNGAISLELGFPENFAGAELAVSFGISQPFKPPFKDASGKVVETVKFLSLKSHERDAPKVESVLWSAQELITFGVDNPARDKICRNEEGYLHVHTRGMFRQKVKVEIYKHDPKGAPALLKSYDNLEIVDNVLYLPVTMQEIYGKAERMGGEAAAGKDFEIFARVVPADQSIKTCDGKIIQLSVEKASLADMAMATIKGIMKFIIGEAPKKEEKNCGGKYCITKANYKDKNAGKLIQEINIRLAGFGGNVPTEEFTDRTEATIKQFQRDYMNVPETGKICGGLLKAIDEFCTKYSIDFSQAKCKCGICSGFGDKSNKGEYISGSSEKYHKYEYPGIHRSLLWGLKAALFYLEKDGRFQLNKINSGYRCRNHEEYKKKPTTNHMGKALDLHFNDNKGKRTQDTKDMNTIRKDIFKKYLGATEDWIKQDVFNLESEAIGATSWVHVDVREFNPTQYLKDEFFAANTEQLNGELIIDVALQEGFKDLCNCLDSK